MKRTIKLVYEPQEERWLIIYATDSLCYCYKVDNVNPPMLSRVFEVGYNPYKREEVVDEMSEFVQEEFKKIEGN
ncbi:hypothetical protein [Chryseobacterium sp. ZHDP1]|uniref:hypothetical protein n=1 Tax=Chryseobacterium sp. ZHDP1 TaxID=2838877 RepID=UPI001BDFF1A3|nr:hypothetical protein [Chryseobacterium sp. ZHDP1]QWA38884.1 hypothetical protein KKI44_01345 [Chryseobacterium sp. ZHDP1]